MEKKDKGFIIEDNVLKGTENVVTDIKETSVGKVILDKLQNDPNFVGQYDGVTGEEHTHRQIYDRSVRCALWMKKHGLCPGDVVAICTHNHLDVVMPCFGALYLGAIFNPLDTGLHANDFRHIMKITKPKMAFVNEQVAKTIVQIAEDIKLDLTIVVFGRVPGLLEFENIISEARVDEVENFECTQIKNADQTAVIMCTSGTTGAPKGVQLAHSVFLKQITNDKYTIIRNKTLIFTPLAWYSGVLNIIMSTCTNITRLVPPPFEEYIACELIERHKIICTFVAPNMINRLLKSNAMSKYDLSSLKVIICGGSPLADASKITFTKLLPNVTLTIGYGMTEAGGVVSWQVPGAKFESCGRIVGSAQVKVIDPTTGQILGPNQQGELLLKTNVMMNGYYNNPQATAETIDEEGWLHSGDLGYYDEDGDIFVVDRLKELIKYRGYHISPVEIENLLLTHPEVKEVAVVGLPHPVDDEHPIAFVVRNDSSIHEKQVTEEELVDFVAAEVSDSKKLRGGVKFVKDLPKTPSNKIQRRDVRALAKSLAAT